jgi:serine/threonine-protein kinase RsbT
VEVLPIQSGDDVVRVRQQVRVLASDIGLSLVDQTKLVTAASELVKSDLGRSGVKVQFIDEGNGIADIDRALTDGYSTGSGLGLGLSGARRLVDSFELASAPGIGTTVVVIKWSR